MLPNIKNALKRRSQQYSWIPLTRLLQEVSKKHLTQILGGIHGAMLVVTFKGIITGVYWGIGISSATILLSSPRAIEKSSSKKHRTSNCSTVNGHHSIQLRSKLCWLSLIQSFNSIRHRYKQCLLITPQTSSLLTARQLFRTLHASV